MRRCNEVTGGTGCVLPLNHQGTHDNRQCGVISNGRRCELAELHKWDHQFTDPVDPCTSLAPKLKGQAVPYSCELPRNHAGPHRGPCDLQWSDSDPVNHPAHYTNHASGVECIDIVEHMTFNRGNAIKYIWRAGEKGPPEEDLRKAIWHLEREIKRIG